MKLGIIGLSQSGKLTLFEALTRSPHQPEKRMENRLASIHVPDERVDWLSGIYEPKKTTFAQIEYFLPGAIQSGEGRDQSVLNQIRGCDALVHVIRNFVMPGFDSPDIKADFDKLQSELIFSDLLIVEKRLEKIEAEKKRPVKPDPEEEALLIECRKMLEADLPLRGNPQLAGSPLLRGFAFLSGRPMLVIINNDEENESLPDVPGLTDKMQCMAVRAKLEYEIALMEDSDAETFMEEYGISEPAVYRVIRLSYDILGLMSFLTVGKDEVRAWTIRKGTHAVDAAEAIHSDIKKGFIRAEVVAFNDLKAAGSHAEARKKGTVRLEGKTYIVRDGDIIDFRFNV
jgi:ribosome-binding ATPase